MTSSAAAARRLIKEELDDNFVTSSRPTRRVVLGSRRKALKEAEVKKRRGYHELSYDSDGEVELVRSTAPRRPYQWRGRRVQRVFRPGTVVSFTPGERSGAPTKRSYGLEIDEMVSDLGYGKRARTEALVLDTSNSTPSLRPVTSQTVLPIAGVKRRVGDFQPTVQVMVPLKRARDQSPSRSLEDVAVGDLPAGTMEVEDIKVRPVKQVTPEVGVQTVDVNVNVPTVSQEVQTEGMMVDTPVQYRFRRRRATVPRGVRYHPSISLGMTVVRAHRRRRSRRRRRTGRTSTTTRRRRWIAPTHTRSGDILPRATYHPSIIV